MLTNTLTNTTKHQHRVAKSHSAWNHAGKNTQTATAKMNLFLFTLWRHMEGCRLQLHSRLPSALFGIKLSNSHPGRFTPGENDRWKQWIRSWVDPRIDVDAFGEEKNFSLLLGIDPRLFCRPARGLISVPTTLSCLPYIHFFLSDNMSQ